MNKGAGVGVHGLLKIRIYLGKLWKMKVEEKLGCLLMDLNLQQWLILHFIGNGEPLTSS